MNIHVQKTTTFTCEMCGIQDVMSDKHFKSLRKTGRPAYCSGCRSQIYHMVNRQRVKSLPTGFSTANSLSVGGCTLVPRTIGRCTNYLVCKMYERCLDAAAEQGWDGWTVQGGMK